VVLYVDTGQFQKVAKKRKEGHKAPFWFIKIISTEYKWTTGLFLSRKILDICGPGIKEPGEYGKGEIGSSSRLELTLGTGVQAGQSGKGGMGVQVRGPGSRSMPPQVHSGPHPVDGAGLQARSSFLEYIHLKIFRRTYENPGKVFLVIPIIQLLKIVFVV